MATLDEKLEFTQLAQVRNRVRGVLYSRALAVMDEADDTPNYQLRRRLAVSVLSNADQHVDRFVAGAAMGPYSLVQDYMNSGMAIESVEDTALEWVVNDLWTKMSAVVEPMSAFALGIPVTPPEPPST